MRRRRQVVGVAFAVVLMGFVGLSAAAVRASPPEVPPGFGAPPLPLPPVEEGGEFAETDGETEGIDEEALLEQRFEEHMENAAKAMARKRFREAVSEYDNALDLRENDPEVLELRAEAHKGLAGNKACATQAIEDLALLELHDPLGKWVQKRGRVVEWMSECGERYADERLQLAEVLANLEPGAPGRSEDIRVLVATERVRLAKKAARDIARDENERAAIRQLVAYDREMESAGKTPREDALEMLGDLYRERGEPQKALAAYQRLMKLEPGPADVRVKRVTKWIAEIELQLEVQKLQKLHRGPPTPEGQAAFDRGRAALSKGERALARREFEHAVKESPWFPPAQYYLGEVYAREGKIKKAEDALRRAALLDPYDFNAHRALGMLYKKEYALAESQDSAIRHLEKAHRIRPDLYELHFHLGELWASSDKEKARQHFRDFVERADIDDPLLEQAREALDELRRDFNADEPDVWELLPLPSASAEQIDPELYEVLSEARVRGADRGDWKGAKKTLLGALQKFPESTELLNTLAAVCAAQGDHGEARVYWEQSLAVDQKQRDVHERLGLMLQSEEGLEHLRQAAELGSVVSRIKLTRRLYDRYALWEASDQLDNYLREAGPYDLRYESAQALRAEMDTIFFRIYAGVALFLGTVLLMPTMALYRRLRGASVAQLLERSPKSFPEVARILSLIRHEILKHNTAFLTDVGRALELDEPDAEARAHLLARRLFGEDGGPSRGERRGIYGRFLGYVKELEKVGRAHGVTLNLRRKDPIFRDMLQAFEEVSAHGHELRHPGGLRSRRKLDLARVLNRAGDVLGRSAFESLSGLLESLCVADVDSDLIADVFQRVATEDKFATAQLGPLEVRGEGDKVRIFRTDLEDILTNVFRNSLVSSLQYSQAPHALGVDLIGEVDEITGLSSLAIRIKDRSPEQLTNEMLRGRYVERGMGITADLLSRYDGSIAVEAEPGWEKAVVLRFFSLEEQTA